MRAALLLALGLAAAPAWAGEDFAYVRDAAAALASGAVAVDARPQASCEASSIAGARCLPASDFLGRHGQLPSWRDVLWLLGTAGLSGAETVLVVGQDARERDFVAGMLYLAGQQRVLILAEPVPRVLAAGVGGGPGARRAFAREGVFAAPMRDRLVILAHELRAMVPPPLLLDGRSAEEYWGEKVRTARGGHLPGAQSLPAASLRAAPGSAPAALSAASPAAYGHDAFEGIAYFTLLRAGHGVDARVFPEGWAAWAADGTLPADSVTHPDLGAVLPTAPIARTQAWSATAIAIALALAGTAAAFAAGLWLGLRRRTV